ncbi:PfkB family carbohydrate kinase [Brevibacterium sp. SMBL_HHYL_HB1]|uniref:carbohydrate kinase family protein n=1 Tax=Brevibacterium sp. SMBL_HHYL_HB1 TaxID=2777556 RepID=UPI001BAD1226|nr:PfkB family carbohydrate kinase [Brevibacterium sp. SMBL_HHYL_HB1]QUL77849.1 sugar kinase [Brevibacterium sp. SMBL_HHYL_HB1]
MARVLTVGMHLADVLGRYVEAIPEGQGIQLLDEIRLTVAGTAAATAVNLAHLGETVSTVGVVGDDALGTFIVNRMHDTGVSTEHLRVDQSLPTSATMLPIRRDGSRPALHVVSTNGQLNEQDLQPELLNGTSLVHLGGSCLLPGIDGRPSADFLQKAKEHGAIVTMDFIPSRTSHSRDWQAIELCLPFVDYLLPSDDDAYYISRADGDRHQAIDYYLDAGVKNVLITMGEHGVSISNNDQQDLRLPAFDVDVVDTTGCGDAFAAGFIAELMRENNVLAAAEYGLACGSLMATGLGSDAVDLTRPRVEDFRRTASRSAP